MCPGFPFSELSQMPGDTGSVSEQEGAVIFRGNLWNGNRVEDPGQASELGLCSWGESRGAYVSRRQGTPPAAAADTEMELRDSPPADSQINTSQDPNPAQTTSTTMNHQPSTPAPLPRVPYTRGKKERTEFLTS